MKKISIFLLITAITAISFFSYGEESTGEPIQFNTIIQKEAPDTVTISGEKTLVYYSNMLDKSAEYPGGMSALMAFLGKNITFTTSCYQPEGRLIAKCLVTHEGKVEKVEIIQSLAEHEDGEVIRIASMMNFIPAELNGHPVASWFILPISFRNADSQY